EAGENALQLSDVARLYRPQKRAQISPGGERRLRLPDHQSLVVGFGARDRLDHAFHHVRPQRVQFALEGENRHVVGARPDAGPESHGIVLEYGLALWLRLA